MTGIRASLLPDLEELALNGIDQRQFQARDDADFLRGALDALLNALPPCAAVRKQPLRLHQATAKPSASKVGNDSGRPADAPGGTGGLPRPLGVVGLEVLEGDPVDLVGLRGRRHDEAPSPTPTAPSPPRTATSTAGAATPGRAASRTRAARGPATSSPRSPGAACRRTTRAPRSRSATTTASSSSSSASNAERQGHVLVRGEVMVGCIKLDGLMVGSVSVSFRGASRRRGRTAGGERERERASSRSERW